MFAELIGVWQNGAIDTDVVPSTTATVLDLPAGSDADVGFTLVDSIGARVNLDVAGNDVLELRAALYSGALLFSKRAVAGAGIGRFTFEFAAADTKNYRGKLIFEVWATRDGEKQRVMAPGHLQLGLGALQ